MRGRRPPPSCFSPFSPLVWTTEQSTNQTNQQPRGVVVIVVTVIPILPNHRPRARTTLVDIEKQQPQRGGEGRLPQHNHDDDDDDGIFFQPPPELAYRDADYDTDPGVSMTRRRTGGSGIAVVDMLRSTGRERGVGLGGGGGGEEVADRRRLGYRSDGGCGRGEELCIQEGEVQRTCFDGEQMMVF